MKSFFCAAFEKHHHAIVSLLFLGVVTFGHSAFNQVIVGDDWHAFFTNTLHKEVNAQVGRSLIPVVRWLAFDNRVARGVTLFFAFSMIVLAAWFLSDLIKIEASTEKFIFTALFVFNPVLAEHYMFHSHHVYIGVGFLLSVLSIYFTCRIAFDSLREFPFRKHALSLLVAAVCFAGAVSLRQSFSLVIAVVLIGALKLAIVSNKNEGGIPTEMLLGFARGCGMVFLSGLVLYFIFNKLVQWGLNVGFQESGDYAFMGGLVCTQAQAADNLRRVVNLIGEFLLKEQHLWPLAAKISFMVVLVIYLFKAFQNLRLRRYASRSERGVMCLMVVGAVAGLIGVPWLIAGIRVPVNAYRYTALLGVVPIYPFVYCGALSLCKNGWARWVILTLSFTTIASFAFFQNVASIAAYTTNERDLAVVQRILTRIETHSKYREFSSYEEQEVVLVGRVDYDRKRDWPFSQITEGMMNDSVISKGVLNRQVYHISEIVKLLDYPTVIRGYRNFTNKWFMELSTQSRIDIAEVILHSPTWPHYDSIQFTGEKVLVVLGKTEKLQSGLKTELLKARSELSKGR